MLFSVILPTFNRAGLMAAALDSVFAQRFSDFEVIVADDGSTDDTMELLRSYGDRITVVHQENRGPGAARNLGAETAQGRYLAFLDSDDLWFPWTLDVYASVVIGTLPQPVFIAGKPAVFHDATELARQVESPIQALTFRDYYASGDEWRWYSASSFVIRADAFRQVGGFAPEWINGEDADLAMRLGTLGGFVQVAAPATFGYRDHAGSLVSQTRKTLEGIQYALRMEQGQQYPGGATRARERRTIMTRQFRPVMLTCLRERQFAEAWRLYLATWSWHLALGRLRFLVGFPVQALLAMFRSPGGAAGLMTAILGISAFYHDSAAVLLRDGQIVAAAQEERFTRKKHDHHFPQNAVAYCLREAGLAVADLDHVAFYDRPRTKFARLIDTFTAMAPAGFSTYQKAMPLWLNSKLHLQREFDRALGGQHRGRYVFTDHHEAHAASAFFPSPFEDAAILTLDGAGEWSTTAMGHGRGNRITLSHEIRFPHSLGLLYSAFTYYTGFRVNSGEYKVMGLAPYGEPRFAPLIREHLIQIRDDGSFWMDQAYFNYCAGVTMTSEKFHRLFGAPPRDPESRLTQREMDLAASVQVVCEEVMLSCARHVHAVTRSKNLVMAGGVALNCVGNGRILREGPFERIWIQPAAGDAGGALGAAQIAWHHLLRQPRTPAATDSLQGSYLGPSFTDAEVRDALRRHGAVFHAIDDEPALLSRVVDLLAHEKVIGWFQGRMEFGPRALGARSILGDPRSPKTQQVMNLKIKFRESFRPFAPSVLREHCGEYFDMAHDADSPYMLIVAPVREDRRIADSAERMRGLEGIEKLNVPRSVVPSITHVDFSARIQTVTPEANGRYYRLIKRFYDRTQCPMLVNTSFNIRGEPIVCTPEDALRCFLGTDMDALVLENTLLLKEEQTQAAAADVAAYKRSFALD